MGDGALAALHAGGARRAMIPPMPSTSEVAVSAPFAGVVVRVDRAVDGFVRVGAPLLVLEAMKMEHEVLAETAGVVRRVAVAAGETVHEGQLLLVLEADGSAAVAASVPATAAGTERPDLEAVRARHALGLDAARAEAV